MKNKKVFWIIVLLIIILTIGLSIYILKNNKENDQKYTKEDETGEKVNTSEDLNKEKTFGDYKVSSISLKTEAGANTLTATIENVSSKTTEEGVYNLVFTDKSGQEKGKITVFIKSMTPNETVEIRSTINLDVIDSYNFKLEKA